MTNFRPGLLVSQINNEVLVRYPKWEDLDEMVDYVNKLSVEDTYVLISGEIITKQDEARYLSEVFWNIESNNGIFLLLYVDNKLAGIADVTRDFKKRKRSLHVGTMGISIASHIRGKGLGLEFAKILIREVQDKLYNLKQIELDVFANNQVAYNLYKKLGFLEVGRVPKRFLHKGQYIDQIIMTLQI